MTLTPSLWSLLGFAAWTLLLLLAGVGPFRVGQVLGGKARSNEFPADVPHGPPGYRRLLRAHANCVENLPVFATLVLVAHVVGLRSATFELLCVVVLGARLAQSLVHVASGSEQAVNARFAFFLVQVVAFLWLGAIIVANAA